MREADDWAFTCPQSSFPGESVLRALELRRERLTTAIADELQKRRSNLESLLHRIQAIVRELSGSKVVDDLADEVANLKGIGEPR